jgi:hemoglobin
MKRQITNREDVAFLVKTFYDKVRKDENLGPIFNGIIKDWDAHLEKLTDFWEGNLFVFVKTKFTGNPAEAHQRVDEAMNGTIEMEHFGRWMNLWIANIDEHFEGEIAGEAKSQARKMAAFLYLRIFEKRRYDNPIA